MAKQTKSLTTFTELTHSELYQISGGDWWIDWFNKIIPSDKRKADSIKNHKIG